jgi:hypothetical protein
MVAYYVMFVPLTEVGGILYGPYRTFFRIAPGNSVDHFCCTSGTEGLGAFIPMAVIQFASDPRAAFKGVLCRLTSFVPLRPKSASLASKIRRPVNVSNGL